MDNLVLLSGGMDSATALGLAMKDSPNTMAVSIRYGSVHSDSEAKAALAVANWYGLGLHEVCLPHSIFRGGQSSLLGESEIPTEEYHDPEKETPSSTVVPFRNALFISVAVAMAEAQGCARVWLAVHATDHLGFAYPDCSPEFIGSMLSATYIGTHRKVRLITPFLWISKAQIVRLGMELRVPYQLTWSCYRGGDSSCGECPTCLERKKAFAEACYFDPIPYLKEG